MNTILQLLRNNPFGVALFVLSLVALSPEKKNPSLIRGTVYLAAYLICGFIGVCALVYKPGVIGDGVIACIFMSTILHYQKRLIKKCVRKPLRTTFPF